VTGDASSLVDDEFALLPVCVTVGCLMHKFEEYDVCNTHHERGDVA